jgi:hypothetical protein
MIKDDSKIEYKNCLRKLPNSAVSHFPVWDSVNVKSLSYFQENMKTPISLILDVSYGDDKYLEIKQNIENNVLKILNVNDTSFLIALQHPFVTEGGTIIYLLNYPDSMKEKNIITRNINNDTTNIILPIFEQNSINDIGLTDDYKIYFIDSKQGKFINENYYETDTLITIMPKRWEHGYSRGYALSDKQKQIIYWVVVW